MKTIHFSGLVLLSLTTAFVAPSPPLVGRWQKKFPNGDVMLVNFRAGGTYDLFVNDKASVSGRYTLQQDDFTVRDGSCNLAYAGTYKLRFYSDADSIRFTLVQDSCRARRRAVSGVTLGRVKATKP